MIDIKTCSKCRSANIYVVDSRPRQDGIYRRRLCMDCGCDIRTVEITQEAYRELQDKITHAYEDAIASTLEEVLKTPIGLLAIK